MMNNKDILNFVPEDDCVEYYLFPTEIYEENEIEAKLKTCADNVNKLVKEYSADYIWHKDPFTLVAKCSSVLKDNDELESIPPHLYGITYYGDNIEDEWFIVYLLKQITKEIDHIVARIVDSDGEFLLIEAADYLPDWANPETCDKRVYISRGHLHIVAPKKDAKDEKITIAQAVHFISKNHTFTQCPEGIQSSINRKISGYPEKIKENQHHANAYLPVAVAALLNENPNLVAAATSAFVNRDVMDMKHCRAMKYFPPEVRVRSRVTFTKCLYAMLMNSKYVPDRKTGWNLPTGLGKDYKEHLLGVKLACGFEILVCEAKPNNVEGDKKFAKYVEKLKENGYFNDLFEESQEYKKRYTSAKEYYLENEITKPEFSTGAKILQTLKNLEYSVDSLKELEDAISEENDDESWLNISPDELDKMLETQYGKPNIFKFDRNSDASKFTETLDSFLNHVSDIDGAEFPNGQPPSRPPRQKKDTTSDSKINFDPSSFACAVQDILNFVIPEDNAWESSDSEMSDYGKDENLCGGMGDMKTLMEEMDRELAGTTIGKSFMERNENFDDIEEFKPVDIDLNALKNIMESYKNQMGEAGPSTNMLGPMGVRLEKDE